MESGLALVGALGVAGGSEAAGTEPLSGSFPIVELRQYTLHPGKRDTLVDLFEREFVDGQEALGMKVIGTFNDLDRSDRFVWLRGFKDMDSRLAGLTAFYGGPVWKAHREAANATMIDSDNVLLLRAASGAAAFDPSLPRNLGAAGDGLVVARLYHLKGDPQSALKLFEGEVLPGLNWAGIRPLAWFVPEQGANTFPRLPVREGEQLLVWFAAFESSAAHEAATRAIADAEAALAPLLAQPAEVLRLKPTPRAAIEAGCRIGG